MNYQLVIQLSDSVVDFDELVAVESELLSVLGTSADVDGHDFGSGEGNVFILTNDPSDTLRHVLRVLEARGYESHATVAYRPVRGGEYTVLWPRDHHGKFSLA